MSSAKVFLIGGSLLLGLSAAPAPAPALAQDLANGGLVFIFPM